MKRFLLVLAALLPAAAQAQQAAGPLPRPEPRFTFTVQNDVMVPMRDGVRLATDLYLPTGAGEKLPVIVIRTPYNKNVYRAPQGRGNTNAAAFFAGHGYAVVAQDTRGKFASEGEYEVEVADRDDGYDTIDWAAKQAWSNGRIGTYGCSYLGEVQYLLAKMRHPNHAAMIVQAGSAAIGPAGGYYTNFGTFEGGALTLSSIFGWFGTSGSKVKGATRPQNLDYPGLLRSLPLIDMAKQAGYPPSDFENFVSHPPADPYWERMGYLRDDDRFDVPAIHVNSWLDLTPEQTLYIFNLMQRNAVSTRARDNQFAILSPTVHCSSEAATERTRVGQREFGDARLPYFRIYLDWFDHWLKGVENGVTDMPRVRYYVMGLNEWRSAPAWPIPDARPTPYYLTSGGRANTSRGNGLLTTTLPEHDRTDTFTYDPANPFPSRGGTICCTGNRDDQPGVFDQSDLESRDDLLVYTTPVLERGVTIAGSVKVVLHVSSDAKDTDFTAKLIDVDRDGRAWNIMTGILRARYREGMTRTVWMQQGQVYRVEINLKAGAFHFPAGHRIRLHVTSSDFPAYDRNLNTGGDNWSETTWVKAMNTVHHGPRFASHLLLPVVSARSAQSGR